MENTTRPRLWCNVLLHDSSSSQPLRGVVTHHDDSDPERFHVHVNGEDSPLDSAAFEIYNIHRVEEIAPSIGSYVKCAGNIARVTRQIPSSVDFCASVLKTGALIYSSWLNKRGIKYELLPPFYKPQDRKDNVQEYPSDMVSQQVQQKTPSSSKTATQSPKSPPPPPPLPPPLPQSRLPPQHESQSQPQSTASSASKPDVEHNLLDFAPKVALKKPISFLPEKSSSPPSSSPQSSPSPYASPPGTPPPASPTAPSPVPSFPPHTDPSHVATSPPLLLPTASSSGSAPASEYVRAPLVAPTASSPEQSGPAHDSLTSALLASIPNSSSPSTQRSSPPPFSTGPQPLPTLPAPATPSASPTPRLQGSEQTPSKQDTPRTLIQGCTPRAHSPEPSPGRSPRARALSNERASRLFSPQSSPRKPSPQYSTRTPSPSPSIGKPSDQDNPHSPTTEDSPAISPKDDANKPSNQDATHSLPPELSPHTRSPPLSPRTPSPKRSPRVSSLPRAVTTPRTNSPTPFPAKSNRATFPHLPVLFPAVTSPQVVHLNNPVKTEQQPQSPIPSLGMPSSPSKPVFRKHTTKPSSSSEQEGNEDGPSNYNDIAVVNYDEDDCDDDDDDDDDNDLADNENRNPVDIIDLTAPVGRNKRRRRSRDGISKRIRKERRKNNHKASWRVPIKSRNARIVGSAVQPFVNIIEYRPSSAVPPQRSNNSGNIPANNNSNRPAINKVAIGRALHTSSRTPRRTATNDGNNGTNNNTHTSPSSKCKKVFRLSLDELTSPKGEDDVEENFFRREENRRRKSSPSLSIPVGELLMEETNAYKNNLKNFESLMKDLHPDYSEEVANRAIVNSARMIRRSHVELVSSASASVSLTTRTNGDNVILPTGVVKVRLYRERKMDCHGNSISLDNGFHNNNRLLLPGWTADLSYLISECMETREYWTRDKKEAVVSFYGLKLNCIVAAYAYLGMFMRISALAKREKCSETDIKEFNILSSQAEICLGTVTRATRREFVRGMLRGLTKNIINLCAQRQKMEEMLLERAEEEDERVQVGKKLTKAEVEIETGATDNDQALKQVLVMTKNAPDILEETGTVSLAGAKKRKCPLSLITMPSAFKRGRLSAGKFDFSR